jgi:hypothetical protein
MEMQLGLEQQEVQLQLPRTASLSATPGTIFLPVSSQLQMPLKPEPATSLPYDLLELLLLEGQQPLAESPSLWDHALFPAESGSFGQLSISPTAVQLSAMKWVSL